MDTLKTIKIKGLKRTGLHMGYYTFRGVKKDCYVHLFANGMHGSIALDRDNPQEIIKFHGLAELKELINTFPDRETGKYTCVMRFRDSNMPSMKQNVQSEEQAISQLHHWKNQFAGVSSFAMWTPLMNKYCFDSQMNYLFTVSASDCKKMNLKP